MDGKGPDHLRPGQVGRTARSRIRPFPLCIIALSRNASCLHLLFNYSQSAFFGQGPPSRYPLDQGVHGLAHEHDALLELNKSNRGSPWTAISRFNRRSRVLMVGRPSAPSMDSSTRLSLALRRRSVGSLSCCRRPHQLERQPRLAHAEATGDGGARLGVVPQGDELRVVGLIHEHVTAFGLIRSRAVAG